MQTKLTLSLDKKIISKAKAYAKKTGRSLSSVVQDYLEQITDEGDVKNIEESPLEKLFGCIELPNDSNDKEMIRDILWNREK